jgi:hypothetical protein
MPSDRTSLKALLKAFKDFLFEWKPVVEFLGIVIILVYTVLTGLLLRENQKANRISNDALNQNRVALERGQRPYVLASKLDIIGDIKSGQTFIARVDVLNYGQTPAIKVDGCADIVLKPNTDPMADDFPCPAPNNPRAGLRRTGEHSITNIGPGTNGSPFTLTTPSTSIQPIEEVLPIFLNGGMRIYAYGDITYADMITPGKVHRTTFCGRWNFPGHYFEVCEKHNSAN